MSTEEPSVIVESKELESVESDKISRISLRAERAGIGALLASLRGENLTAELDDLSTQSQSSDNEDVGEKQSTKESVPKVQNEEQRRPMNRKEKRRMQRLQEIETGEVKRKVPLILEFPEIPTRLKQCFIDKVTFNSYKACFGYQSTRDNNLVHFALQNNEGTRAVVGSQDRYIRNYCLDNSTVLWKHNTGGLVLDSCWENSGKGVFSTSKFRPIQLFDCETGSILGAYNGKDSGDNITEAMCIGQTGDTLIGGYRNQFQFWDIEYTGNAVSKIKTYDKHDNNGFRGIPMSISPHPTMTGLFAAAGTSSIIGTYSVNWKKATSSIEGSSQGYTNLHFSPDGFKIYASERSGDIHCFDTRMNMMIQVLKREMKTAHRTRFDIDATGRLLFSGTSSGDVVIFDLHDTNEEIQSVLLEHVSSNCVPCVSAKKNKVVICTGQRKFPEDSLISEDVKDEINHDNTFQIFEMLSEPNIV